jgi:protein O-mannosyl-transferase
MPSLPGTPDSRGKPDSGPAPAGPFSALLFRTSSHAARNTARDRAIVLAPAIVAIVIYLGALANGFAYDDLPVIPDNDWVRHGMTLTHALTLPYWPAGALYRPVTSFSYAVDWLVGGGSPVLFHAVNIAWYALGAALVTRLALEWWPPLAALLAGLLFAVHPVHVESVANVVGRAELLAGVTLVGLALVVMAPRPLTNARLFGIAALAALALGAKETGVVAPIVAWATAAMRRDVQPGDTRRITLAALVGVALVLAQRATVLGTLAGDAPHSAFLVSTRLQSLALALETLPRALGLLVVPQLPRIDYSPTSAALTHPEPALVLLGAVLVVAGALVVVLHARRPSRWSWAAVFAVATFAPVSNLVLHTGVVLADRTLYSPSIGLSMLAGGALAALLSRHSPLPRPVLPIISLATAVAFVIAGCIYTLRTVAVWHDNVSVFTAMRDRSPTSYRGYYLLGKGRRTNGPSPVAHQDYITAIALFDGDPGLLYDAGMNALGVGDTTDALKWLAAAIDRSPTQRRARTSLVLLHLHRSELAPARQLLQGGLTLEPDQHLWRKILDSLDRAPTSASVSPAPSVLAHPLPAAASPPPAAHPPHAS